MFRWTGINTIFVIGGELVRFNKNEEIELTEQQQQQFRGQIARGHLVQIETEQTLQESGEATTTEESV